MCENAKLDVFAKVSDMSKYLRNSIKHILKYERYGIEDEIRKFTRDMKYKAFLLQSEDCGKELYNMARHLKILLDECIEDKLLLMSGQYTILQPRKLLDTIITLLTPKTDS